MLTEHQIRQLYEQHGAALVLYARQWCNAPEDALQEAMLELMRVSKSPEDPVAWLYTTTKRRAMNIARAEQRRVHHQSLAAEERATWFERPTFDSRRSMLGPRVAEGLERMESAEREILVARTWGGLSYEQLGKLVDCSTSAAHRRYVAALTSLRRLLEEADAENATCSRNTGQQTSEK